MLQFFVPHTHTDKRIHVHTATRQHVTCITNNERTASVRHNKSMKRKIVYCFFKSLLQSYQAMNLIRMKALFVDLLLS